MSLDGLLTRAHDAYRQALIEHGAELRRGDRPVAAELLVQPNGWTSRPPFNLMRVDFAIGNGDDLRLERLVDGAGEAIPAREYPLPSGLRVVAGTVGWEEFIVAFSSAGFEVEMLADWLDRWLDPAEAQAEDEHGLSDVVHGLAWNGEGDRWRLTVDFGSAPVDAARELLGVLAANGVERCTVEPPGGGET